jgi:hypothetical protein
MPIHIPIKVTKPSGNGPGGRRAIINIKERRMRKRLYVILAGLLLAMGLVITGCSSDDGEGIIDDPLNGSMTKETGDKIFQNHVDNGLGGVVIDRFLSEEALKAYLNPPSRAAGDLKTPGLILKKIDSYDIVKIAAGAFTPLVDEEDGTILADISTIVEAIELPPAIQEIAADAFSGLSDSLELKIPESVKDELPPDVLQKIEDEIGTEVETYVPDDNSPANSDPNNNVDPRLYGTWVSFEDHEFRRPTTWYITITPTVITVKWVEIETDRTGTDIMPCRIDSDTIYTPPDGIDMDLTAEPTFAFFTYEILNDDSLWLKSYKGSPAVYTRQK